MTDVKLLNVKSMRLAIAHISTPPIAFFLYHFFSALFSIFSALFSIFFNFISLFLLIDINTYIALAYYINVYKLIKLRIERVID